MAELQERIRRLERELGKARASADSEYASRMVCAGIIKDLKDDLARYEPLPTIDWDAFCSEEPRHAFLPPKEEGVRGLLRDIVAALRGVREYLGDPAAAEDQARETTGGNITAREAWAERVEAVTTRVASVLERLAPPREPGRSREAQGTEALVAGGLGSLARSVPDPGRIRAR